MDDFCIPLPSLADARAAARADEQEHLRARTTTIKLDTAGRPSAEGAQADRLRVDEKLDVDVYFERVFGREVFGTGAHGGGPGTLIE